MYGVGTDSDPDVTLRGERATIERRPVDREVNAADFTSFKGGTSEISETAEEAVIGTRARVVEEVVVWKTSSERWETVSDTVRRTDVDVTRIKAEPAGSAPQMFEKMKVRYQPAPGGAGGRCPRD